jgi:hypothetical protein
VRRGDPTASSRVDPRGYALDVCFIALDKRGRCGAAASNQTFPYAAATQDGSELLRVPRVVARPR